MCRLVSTPEKIQALNGQPLWVDTGERAVDELLSGYLAVITRIQRKCDV